MKKAKVIGSPPYVVLSLVRLDRAHELVLQKGDNLKVPEERKGQRLLADWMQWQGGRPRVRYVAELNPIASETESDPGPGARSKDAKGEWVLLNKHPDDKFMRKG